MNVDLSKYDLILNKYMKEEDFKTYAKLNCSKKFIKIDDKHYVIEIPLKSDITDKLVGVYVTMDYKVKNIRTNFCKLVNRLNLKSDSGSKLHAMDLGNIIFQIDGLGYINGNGYKK